MALPETEKSGGEATLKKARPLIESVYRHLTAGVCDKGASAFTPLTAIASEIGSMKVAHSRRAAPRPTSIDWKTGRLVMECLQQCCRCESGCRGRGANGEPSCEPLMNGLQRKSERDGEEAPLTRLQFESLCRLARCTSIRDIDRL